MAHKNIPIFIPHLGCPNMCVFCNQRSISGKTSFSRDEVPFLIERALSTVDTERDQVQIAFFGGSFTGIDRGDMIYLLNAAKKYINMKLVSGIRLSTRPDYINREILDILKEYGVETIELGIQSLCDEVLTLSKRGHTSEDSRNACRLIKDYGFSLVGQMMLGLPGSDGEKELETARELCLLGVDAVRIYPTAVFCGTELDAMRMNGEYSPLTLEDATLRAGRILRLINDYGVECIRCGLQAQDNLSDDSTVKAGAYHPAFGSMALGKAMRLSILEELQKHPLPPCQFARQIRFAVAPERVFDAYGYKKENKIFFLENYNIYVKFIADTSLSGFDCRLLTGKE